jgi:PIN domain nuclease of toxin-antitoxin system
VRLLLDTHVFLWLQDDPERLGEHLPGLEDTRNDLLVSAATSWEIAIKYAKGRLGLPEPPERYVPRRLRDIGANRLPIDHEDALDVSHLPPVHGDPFDRMLVVQARAHGAHIVTADRVFEKYLVDLVLVGG